MFTGIFVSYWHNKSIAGYDVRQNYFLTSKEYRDILDINEEVRL